MAPGRISQHVHNVQGAQNFGSDVDIDHLRASNCTSCSVRQDKSAYWAPQMYFLHDNGTYQAVSLQGGYTIYYFVENHNTVNGSVPVTPFPKGFRMIAGMSSKRKFYGEIPVPEMSLWQDIDRTQQSLMEKSIGFLCMHYKPDIPAEAALTRHGMPDKAFIDTCDGGIRTELQFPSCWNGIDIDSDNHTSHVAYPYELRDGDCPPGFDKILPTLLYEIIYNTQYFSGMPGQFVFAHGDATGYGLHGDFINGWDDGVQEQFIEQCHDPDGLQEHCPPLDIKPESEVVSCKMETPEAIQNEAVDMVDELPGGCRIVPDVEWSKDCGNPNNQQTASNTSSSSSSQSTNIASKSKPTPESSVAPSPAIASSPSTFSATANTTSAAAPPDTTLVPTPVSDASDSYTTYTTVTTSNGTVYHYIIVEEVVTTTVVVQSAEPTQGGAPGGGVKRHVHDHNFKSRKTGAYGHGGHNKRVKKPNQV